MTTGDQHRPHKVRTVGQAAGSVLYRIGRFIFRLMPISKTRKSALKRRYFARWDRFRPPSLIARDVGQKLELGASAERRVQPFFALSRQTFNDRNVVVTSVIGARHLLHSVDVQHESRVVFADRQLAVDGWEQRPAIFWHQNPKLIVLFHKYALSNFCEVGQKLVWVDSRVSVRRDVIDEIFASLDAYDMCVFRHSERNCVYDEIDAVIEGRRATPEAGAHFNEYLVARDFPRSAGLFETGLMGLRVSPELRDTFRKVFALCFRYAARDQLALPVALADAPLKVDIYNGGETHLRNSPGITVHAWPRH